MTRELKLKSPSTIKSERWSPEGDPMGWTPVSAGLLHGALKQRGACAPRWSGARDAGEGTVTPTLLPGQLLHRFFFGSNRVGEIFYSPSLSLFIYPRLKTVNMGSVKLN